MMALRRQLLTLMMAGFTTQAEKEVQPVQKSILAFSTAVGEVVLPFLMAMEIMVSHPIVRVPAKVEPVEPEREMVATVSETVK